MNEKSINNLNKNNKFVIVLLTALIIVIILLIVLIVVNFVNSNKKDYNNKNSNNTNITNQRSENNESNQSNSLDVDNYTEGSYERVLKDNPIKYKITTNIDLPSDWPYEINYEEALKKETVNYFFDSCLRKEMPTVNFIIENNKLLIDGYYSKPYYFNSLGLIKQFAIRNFQSNTSKYIIILTMSGDIYVGRLFNVCTAGAETVLTPEELESNLIKINLDVKIDLIKKVTSLDTSLIALYADENIFYLNFD